MTKTEAHMLQPHQRLRPPGIMPLQTITTGKGQQIPMRTSKNAINIQRNHVQFQKDGEGTR